MIELSAKTYGDAQQMSAMMRGASQAAEDISAAMPAVAARFHVQMARRFAEQGAGGPSGAWTSHPLSPAYARWKQTHFPGRGMLELTGALKRSLTSFGEGSVTLYGPSSVYISSTVDYAGYHQAGTGTMPRRPPIEPSDKEVSEWAVEVWRYYMKQTSKLGWKGRFAGAMS